MIVLNGDSFFNVDVTELMEFHLSKNADISLSLKEMFDADRYGIIELENDRIINMREKEYAARCYINGGVYVIKRDVFNSFSLPGRFSFEEFLTDNVGNLKIFGRHFDGSFIDIGIPDDYEAALTLIPDWVGL